MSGKRKINLKVFKIKDVNTLREFEAKYRDEANSYEIIPYAKNTPYVEIAESVLKDRFGSWKNDVLFIQSIHRTTLGIQNVCLKANEYLSSMKKLMDLDILSISACIKENRIYLKILVRPYSENFKFVGFFDYVGDQLFEEETDEQEFATGKLLVPDEIKDFTYSVEETKEHARLFEQQKSVYENATKEKPFLNSIEKYVPSRLPVPEDKIDLIYDLKTKDMQYATVSTYEQFIKVFQEVMTYVKGIEYYSYVSVMKGEKSPEEFLTFLGNYIDKTYIKPEILAVEDKPVLMKKLHRALFQLYIVQDLIDDPNVTDIKITAPDSIRARVKGKAYISNITFIDDIDYLRFVDGIAIRNGISLNVPEQTFTDTHDENYILRFTVIPQYTSSTNFPYLHVRKISRKKLMADELMKLGMFDEKVRDYLIDCGKNSRGVVFAGAPGSGKTVCLNWFLEDAYEQSAEILVIQENDELFCYRKGVMIEHVVNYTAGGERAVNLEQLGQLALVAGANVFVIGEAKGAEICSAITLSNSGCRTAITVHSPSSVETIDKMADLAMRGYAQSFEQAKKSLRSFQTIVFLENFKVKEISEIVGYNDQLHDIEYKYIYRRED